MRCPRVYARVLRIGVHLILGGLAACGSFEPVSEYQQTTDPAKIYARLVIDHQPINMATVAPYDTLQLRATPLNALGEPMDGLGTPAFTLANPNDTSIVTVTPDGLLTARQSTDFSDNGYVTVLATLAAAGNVAHVDTAYVYVVDGTPPTLATLSLQPLPPDSAIFSVTPQGNGVVYGFGALFTLLFRGNYLVTRLPLVRALDAGGNPLSGIMLGYRSLDPTIATVISGFELSSSGSRPWINGLLPGQARIVVQTTAFGVVKADTVAYTVTWPAHATVVASPGVDGASPVFSPAEVRIAPYGIVFWQNSVADSVDLAFDDPSNVDVAPTDFCDVLNDHTTFGPGPVCGSGNTGMPPLVTDPVLGDLRMMTTRVRQFREPGIYTYHSVRTGATGRIIVTSDPDLAATP